MKNQNIHHMLTNMLTTEEVLKYYEEYIQYCIDDIVGDCNLEQDHFNRGQVDAYRYCLHFCTDSDNGDEAAKMYPKEIFPIYIFHKVLNRLDEIISKSGEYTLGLKHGYVESLEILQLWKGCPEYGLDFDIEKLYTLMKD